MAHEVETMAWAEQVPWHGLGAQMQRGQSMDEWIAAAGLNWEIQRLPMGFQKEDGTWVMTPRRWAMVRNTDDRALTYTSERWNQIQPKQVIQFMDDYCRAGGAELETCGSLRNGNVIWALARLNHSFTIGKRDNVNGYLLFTSPNQVGMATRIRTTTVRVVCANTMAWAENEGVIEYSQNHLQAFNVDAAKEAVELAHEQLGAAERRAKTIAKLKLSIDDTITKVLVPVFEPQLIEELTNDEKLREILDPDTQPKRIAGIVESINTAPGATPGNGWGVLNGVTHWCDHVQGRTTATRMYRSWMGDYSNKKIETEQRLMELAA